MKISAIIITYNEEEMIEECLRSLDWVDEKLVIDSNSQDQTVKIAQKMGAKVITNKFVDFASTRNFGKDSAHGDWLLYVDADERVSRDLASEIKKSILHTSIAAFSLHRKNYYLGKSWPYIESATRLFQKNKLRKWYGQLHESPLIDGQVSQLQGYLFHYTHRSIAQMVDKTNKWSEIEAQLRVQANHPQMTSWRFFRVMFSAFWNYYIAQGGYKAGTVGIIESLYQSFSMFITYAKLWELQQKVK